MTARRLLLLLPIAAASAVLLAWFDAIPGGWRLRGWVTPHDVRAERERAEHSARRLGEFASENPTVEPGAVLFLGSSTIERYPLAEHFPDVPCLNRGIGNESLPELLDRLEASLPGAAPAGAVLYLASIDFRARGRDPLRIASLAALAVAWLREAHPELPIAVIGILPELDMTPATIERLAETNAALASVCGETGCAFVRTDRSPITDERGSLAPGCAADRLHLNDAGYSALSQWLREEGGTVGRTLAGE